MEELIEEAAKEVLEELGLHDWRVVRAWFDPKDDYWFVPFKDSHNKDVTIKVLLDGTESDDQLKEKIKQALIERVPSILDDLP